MLINSVLELQALTSGMEKHSQMYSHKINQDFCLTLIPNFITAVYKIAGTSDRFPHPNRSTLCALTTQQITILYFTYAKHVP
jgi:archaellum component FlaG (FlaF/FlaG flagellin family)